MNDPFRKVRPGDKFGIPAPVWNAGLDAAQRHQRSRHDATVEPGTQRRSADIVRIRNGTDVDLGRGSVLGIAGPIFGPDANEDAFLREVAFRGVTPTADHAGRFVVLLEPAAPGQVVRGYAAGSCSVVVNVVDEADDRCDVDAGETGRLTSSTTGSAQIVWKESGTGEKNAIIRFGSTCCTAPGPQPPPEDCPSGITACWTVTSDGTTPISGVFITLWDPDDVLIAVQLTEGDGSTCFFFDGPPGEYVVAIEPFCLLPLGGPVTLECGSQSFAVTADSLDPDCIADTCGCDYLPLEIGWQVDYTRAGDPMAGRSGRATLNAITVGLYSSPLVVFDAPWNFGGANYRSARVFATCSLSGSTSTNGVGITYYQNADGTGFTLDEGAKLDCVSGALNLHDPFCPDGEYSRSFCTRDFFSNAIPYMTVSWP